MAFTFSCSDDDGGDSSSSDGSSSGGSSSSVGVAACTAADNTDTQYCSNGVIKIYGTMTDDNGKSYKTVVIGGKTWMAENLNYDVPDNDTDVCYYNDPDKCDTYGRLYNWATAMALPSKCNSTRSTSNADCAIKSLNHQGLCPSGWHIPSSVEWNALFLFVDGKSGIFSLYQSPTAGKHLKAQEGWDDCGPSGSGKDYLCEDTYGFAALPGGSGSSSGNFSRAGNFGNWWSTKDTETYTQSYAYYRFILNSLPDAASEEAPKISLQSVRCLQN
jgi:uncharacterized protein (TIGR02145 family)